MYYCFNITSRCNMKCKYCYRVGNDIGDVTYEKACRYIDLLVKCGCKKINISGGEPLLHENWREIICYAFDKGLDIILSTNGLLLDLDDDVLKKVKIIAIPLDGSNYEINEKTRSKEQFNKCMKIIDMYNSKNYDFNLRINTVVTKHNYCDIKSILNMVNYNNITWKLFDYRRKGVFNILENEFIVSGDMIDILFEDLCNCEMNCDIRFQGDIEKEFGKFEENPRVLNFDGNLYYTKAEQDVLLCNLDEEFVSTDNNELVQIVELNN